MPDSGVSAEARAAVEDATIEALLATAVSALRSVAAPLWSLDRTTSRCGVSATGLPGWLPLGGLPPEPEDIAVPHDVRWRPRGSQTLPATCGRDKWCPNAWIAVQIAIIRMME
jgi:hypothetical protein